jgi:hypothetical protein
MLIWDNGDYIPKAYTTSKTILNNLRFGGK